MKYKRNSDPDYYIDNQDESNCGSFALNLQGWYDPESYFYDYLETNEMVDWMLGLTESYEDDEIATFYAEILVEGMLKEFEGELRRIARGCEIESNEELIEFRTFCFAWDETWDFHFKVFRDGIWQEKNGDGPVHECEEEEWGDYCSEIIYLAHKVV